MNTYELVELDDNKNIINDIELTNYEFKQALTMHKRLAQKKER